MTGTEVVALLLAVAIIGLFLAIWYAVFMLKPKPKVVPYVPTAYTGIRARAGGDATDYYGSRRGGEGGTHPLRDAPRRDQPADDTPPIFFAGTAEDRVLHTSSQSDHTSWGGSSDSSSSSSDSGSSGGDGGGGGGGD